jgi:hypothetical protein
LHVGASQTYKTIAAAYSVASVGDTVIVHAGTYVESVALSKANLKIINYPGARPIIQGNFILGANDIEINGLEIVAWAAGKHGIYASNLIGIRIRNCIIHDGGGTGSGSTGGINLIGCAQSLVENNTIYKCETGIKIVTGYSTDNTYENGTIIRNNTVRDQYIDGIIIHGEYITINGNSILDNITTDWQNKHPDGIQFIAASAGGYTNASKVKIYNNLIRNHTQNIFIETKESGESTAAGEVYIWNNVIYNASSGLIHGVDFSSLATKNIAAGGNNGLYIYNNTIGYAGNASVSFRDGKNGTYHFKNNILIQSGNRLAVKIDDLNDFSPGEMDYNLYDLDSSSTAIFADNTWFKTLWHFKSSFATQEIHGKSETAGVHAFPVPSPALPTSACVNAGVYLGTPYNTDKRGVLRPQGPVWDIGAYQYSEKSSLSSPSNFRKIGN